MLKGFSRYKMVYSHLWHTFGSSWKVRISYVLQFMARICKLIALPVAISLIIARLSVHDYPGASRAVLIYACFSLALGILTPLLKYVGMLGENKVYRSLTANYFSRLVNSDINYFNSNLSGYLTTATRHYVDSSISLARSLRDRYMGTILSIIFPLGVILWLDPILGLVTFMLSAVQAGYLLWASSAIGPYRLKSHELYRANSGRMSDIISNILAVKSSAQEQAYTQRIKQAAYNEASIFTQRYTIQAKLIAAREFISVIFFLVLLWLTVQRMSDGHIGITAAVLVVTYTVTILTGIYGFSDELDEHDDLIDKIVPAFEILERKNKITDPADAKQLKNVRGDIQLKEVTFAYDGNKGGRPVFQNFSLTIPSGQKIGVVGLSGAGKSTLVKLLLRFDDVDSGQILLDGIDIRDVRQTDLRSQVAYVPQEPLLFHASIKENVLLSRPEALQKDLELSLKAAHALTFVHELPEGLDSIVGERGVKLSGGQKQRIAIARAVLQKSKVMILDEATSALDSESEHIIKSSFAEILKDKTAIVIAHRLSTLSEMDRIIVIDKGKLAEDGTHTELISQKGIYYRLWNKQQRDIET